MKTVPITIISFRNKKVQAFLKAHGFLVDEFSQTGRLVLPDATIRQTVFHRQIFTANGRVQNLQRFIDKLEVIEDEGFKYLFLTHRGKLRAKESSKWSFTANLCH